MSDETSQGDLNNRREVFGRAITSGEIIIFRFDDTTKRLFVDALTEIQGYGVVGVGSATVASAGTAVQLASNSCKRVYITAHEANGELTNGGLIVVGGSTVVATSASRTGVGIYAGQTLPFLVSNTNLLYINSLDTGAKVHFYFEN